MPRIVAGLMALVALGASILAGNDPATCLLRGLVAFMIGNLIGSIWATFVSHRTPSLFLADRPAPSEPATHEEAAQATGEPSRWH